MSRVNRVTRLLLVSVLACTNVAAHHNSGSAFDLESEISLNGVVTRYQYRNPHIYIQILADDGVEWRVEAGPTAIMNRLGWSRDTINSGDRISILGNPSRSEGKASAYLKSGTVNDVPLPPSRGSDAYQRLSEEKADPDVRADSLEGTWVTLLSGSSGWVDEPQSLPLTQAGREAIDNFDERTMSPALDCTPMTAPATMLIPDTKSIEISDDIVRIGSEFNGEIRTIHLDGHTAAQSSTQGHSAGELDGNRLLIDTSGFEVHRMGIAYGLPSGQGKQLHEELVLEDDGQGLTYSFVLTDPEYLREPVSGEIYWAYQPQTEFTQLPCDLENSRLFLDE